MQQQVRRRCFWTCTEVAKESPTGTYHLDIRHILIGGQEIAVKRLSKSFVQGLDELRNEIILIAELQLHNLVRPRGCCIHEDKNMLIYGQQKFKLFYFWYEYLSESTTFQFYISCQVVNQRLTWMIIDQTKQKESCCLAGLE